jgi:hypothetical protein
MIPGMDWWLYDATTGEYAAMNTADLTNWTYTPKPVNVTFLQTDITAGDITWELPATDGTEMLAGGFTIERSNPYSGGWDPVGSDIATAFRIAGTTIPLQFRYTLTAVQAGTYTYRITYSYGSYSGEAATVAATVNDAATLDGLDSNHNGVTDLDEILGQKDPTYAKLTVVTNPQAISVKAGATITFTASATGGGGTRDLAYPTGNAMHYGSITSATDNGDSITFVYKASKNVEGADSLVVLATDDYLAKFFSISITVYPDTLTATPGVYVTHEETTPIYMTLEATGGDGPPYSFAIATSPHHGTITLDDPATGAATFTPDIDFLGDDSFTFTADDHSGSAPSAPATVIIHFMEWHEIIPKAVTIQLDALIPHEYVADPISWGVRQFHEGDNRHNGQDSAAATACTYEQNGHARMKQTCTLFLDRDDDPDGALASDSHVKIIAKSRMYDRDEALEDTRMADGTTILGSGHIKYDSWMETVPGNHGLEAAQTASDENMTLSVDYWSKRVVTAHISGSASDPLASGSEWGPITYDIHVTINSASSGGPTYTITGNHTQFPGFEIYINSQRVHDYDPIPEGKYVDDLLRSPREFSRTGQINQ